MDLASLLAGIVSTLQLLSKLTTSTIDDQFVGFLEAVRNSPALLEWVQSLLDANIPETALRSQSVPENAKAALALSGFDLATLVQYLPLLIEILRSFRRQPTP